LEEEPQHKSPAELGEAVAKKIDELFGNVFADQEPQKAEKPDVVRPAERPAVPAPAAIKERLASPASAPPVAKAVPSEPTVRLPDAPVFRQRTGPPSFESVVDRIEALILKVEWEVSSDAVEELLKLFKALIAFVSQDERARVLVGMNARVLERFKTPDVAPHPLMVKFLQGSVEALKVIRNMPENRSATDQALRGLKDTYNRIITAEAVPDSAGREIEKTPRAAVPRGPQDLTVEKIGLAIQSLQEVSGRLTRIVDFLMQTPGPSGDETGRRLKTLEQVLAQRVNELSSLHRDLPRTAANSAAMLNAGVSTGSEPEGLMMVVWNGSPVAIASSILTAAYPLSKAQAEQFKDKPTVTLGPLVLQKLPIKVPAGRGPVATLPAWLFHLKIHGKDFFLLADRALGFRRVPKGYDITRGATMKIGPTSYLVLSPSSLRRVT
jgi:hypothetical protein